MGESWLNSYAKRIATAGFRSKLSDVVEPVLQVQQVQQVQFSTSTALVMDDNVCLYVCRQRQAVRDFK